MFNDKLNFLSNSDNGIKASGKRLKLWISEYFRNLSTPAGLFSPRNTLLSRFHKNERWFSRTIVFSHDKTNSCGVAIRKVFRISEQI